MFKKADIPANVGWAERNRKANINLPVTNVVPATGNAVTIGGSPATKPKGSLCIPAKMMANKTAMPIVIALNVPSPLSWLSVRGRLTTKQSRAAIALPSIRIELLLDNCTHLNPIVHNAEFDNVLRSFAPTRQ